MSVSSLVLIAGLAVAIAAPAPALAQNALGNGYNLQTDLNRIGGGGFRRSHPVSGLQNAIMTGNAGNGLNFRGQRGISNPSEFQGRLGSDDIRNFEQRSLSSQAAGFGVSASQINALQRSQLTGGASAPGIGGSLIRPRSGYGVSQPSMGYKSSAAGYRPSQTTLSAAGGLFGVDPFGQTRSGMLRDVTLANVNPDAGRRVTPGGLGGERNLMRDLSTQLSSDITRPGGGGSLAGSARPRGITGVGSGLQGQDPKDNTPDSPFGANHQFGLNTALKAGKGYDKDVLAQTSNAEGWRQMQTAGGLTGVQVRTQAPPGMLPTNAPDRDAKGPKQDNIIKSPGHDVPMTRLDTAVPTPRTAYEGIRDRLTKYTKDTRTSRADGSDLLNFPMTRREAGDLTGLTGKDILGMPQGATPPGRGLEDSSLTLDEGSSADRKDMPDWERRIQDVRTRLRQQAAVDSAKSYLAQATETAKENAAKGVKPPNLIQPQPGPSVNIWGVKPPDGPGEAINPITHKKLDPDRKRSYIPSIRLDPVTLKMIRESGGKVETFIAPDIPVTDRYRDFMDAGHRLMIEGKYFDAEEAFARAMNEPSADVTALVARAHAQIGAGLIVSAATNLVRIFTEYPEATGARYAADLLPTVERQIRLTETFRSYAKDDADVGRAGGLLIAYMGYQRGDRAAVSEGLDIMSRIGKAQLMKAAPYADRQLLEDEGRMVELLRGVWLPEKK